MPALSFLLLPNVAELAAATQRAESGRSRSAEERLATDLRFYAWRGDTVIGARQPSGEWAGWAAFRRTRAAGVLDGIWVAPECRGAGVGSELLAATRQAMYDRGSVRIAALVGTASGLRLQIRAGHAVWGEDRSGRAVVDHPLVDGPLTPGVYARSRVRRPVLADRSALEALLRTLP